MFRLFGRQIVQYSLRALMKRLLRNAQEASHTYERNYEQNPFQEQVYADQEIKVSAPRKPGRKDVSEDQIAEDIDYEEVNR